MGKTIVKLFAHNGWGKYSFLTDLNVNDMAKYIVIERPNGVVTIVRSEIETASEEPLTEHEQIINELFSKVKKLDLTLVSKSVEPVCEGTVCCETCKYYPPIGLNKEPCDDCIEYDEWQQTGC